jgi:glycosyltransferase involved in cell wall biosynthesis
MNLTIGILCYETKEETLRCFRALITEVKRLAWDNPPNLVIVDNGKDGTLKAMLDMTELDKGLCVFGKVHTHNPPNNWGQGYGRNTIIGSARYDQDADYILFMDGDIQIVPGSIEQMLNYLETHPKVGCFSPHPVRQTRNSEAATPFMIGYEFILNDIRSACTGYAMYSIHPFKGGIRFETEGPFYGPGWGLEDDDMYLQLTTAGWKVDFFVGIVYLQTKPRSSWASIQAEGVDVRAKFEERKEFFLNKWKTKGVSPSILLTVQGQSLSNLRA